MLHIHVRIDLCLHHVLMTEKASYPDWTGTDLFDNMMRVTPNLHSNMSFQAKVECEKRKK